MLNWNLLTKLGLNFALKSWGQTFLECIWNIFRGRCWLGSFILVALLTSRIHKFHIVVDLIGKVNFLVPDDG